MNLRTVRPHLEMGSARLAAVLVVALGQFSAWGEAAPDPRGRVLVIPLAASNVPPPDAKALSAVLRAQVEALGAGRVVPEEETEAALARPDAEKFTACLEQVACVAQVGRIAGVQQVMVGNAHPEGDDRGVEVRLVDVVAERELGRVSLVLPKNSRDVPPALKEVAARLVAPEKHVGTLVVNGVTGGVDVHVDSQRQSPGKGVTSVRVGLPVGKHSLEVKRNGKPVMTEVVDIRFEEIMVLNAPAVGGVTAAGGLSGQASSGVRPGSKAAERPFSLPVWVGPVVMTLAIPPLLAGLIFGVDLFFIGPLAVANPSSCQPITSPTATGGTQLNPNMNPGNACGSVWRYTARHENSVTPIVMLDVVALAITGLLATGALAVGTLLLVAAVAPTQEDAAVKPATSQTTTTSTQAR